MRRAEKRRMNAKKTHKMPVKGCPEHFTAISEDGWVNVHLERECAQNGSAGGLMAMCDSGRDTRPVCDAVQNMTGCGSKSRKAVMTTPRGNGKSWMTAVKFLIEEVGEEKTSEIIAEVKRKMES